MFGDLIEELTVINRGKKGGKKKKKKKSTRKRSTKSNPGNPKKRRSRGGKKSKTRKRRNPPIVKLNPVGRDILEDIKNGAMVALGVIGGTIAASYAEEKVEMIAEYPWAPGVVMIGSGIAASTFLTGKNRKLGTLLGLGGITVGLVTLIRPYIAGKVPGFEEEAEAVAEAPVVTEPEAVAGYLPAGGFQGYTPSLPTIGQADPFDYPGYAGI